MMHSHPTPPSANQVTPKTILLVEDEALIAMSEKLMLQQHGFTVLTTANGTKAIEIALHTPQLDLILIDINLGSGMDGTDAAQQILAQRDLPIVFLSSHTEPDVVGKTEKITSYGYVVKNSGETVLIASIKMAFKLFDAHQQVKQQKDALRQSEERFRTSVENMLDCFGIYSAVRDHTGRILDFRTEYVNEAACHNNLMPKAEQIGKLLCEILPAHRTTGLFEDYCQVIETGKPLTKESLIYEDVYNRQRVSRAFDIRAVKLGDGFAAAWRDITDRKRAEETLRESRERLIAAQRIAKLGDITWDVESGEITWSDALYDLMQYDRSEKIDFARVNAEIHHPEDLERVTRWLRDGIASGSDKLAPNEYRIIRRDGTVLFVRTEGVIQRGKGKQIKVFVTLQDITDRKRAEEALRESERQLRELNAQKDKFFSILAHDLKNPLVGFLSFANLLEKNFDSMDFEKRKLLIQQFRTSAERLSALLDNLLTWARLQQGQVKSFPIQFPLDHLVGRAVDLLTPNAQHKQITLTNTTPSVEVSANVAMVDAVVRNLLANAIKFTPAGGTVNITATQTTHDVCVTVTDTGVGIPPDKLTQLFRIDGKTQRDGTNGETGTGLGLILCKELVEKQGGTIWVESEPGNGTRVMFTLPTQPR